MEDFIAGWFGGCAGVIVGQPMDTIKVSGLFKGMAPPLTAVALQNAILFGIYGNTLKLFDTQPNGTYKPHQVAIAGSAAGIAQCFIVVPLDLVKIKLQMQTEAKRARSLYKGPLDCIKQIYQVHGIRGYFQGMSTTVMRDVPGFGVYFWTYELLSNRLTQHFDKNSAAIPLTCGGLAGVISWISTFPLDVIKSRLQADGNHGNYRYSGIIDCTKKSFQAEGLGVFTRGLLPTIVRAFPSNAAIFYVYSFCLRILHRDEVASHEI